MINRIGEKIAKSIEIEFIYGDFKKNNGNRILLENLVQYEDFSFLIHL